MYRAFFVDKIVTKLMNPTYMRIPAKVATDSGGKFTT